MDDTYLLSKNQKFCWHYVKEHGDGGCCGIQKGDNDILKMKECPSGKRRHKDKKKRNRKIT